MRVMTVVISKSLKMVRFLVYFIVLAVFGLSNAGIVLIN